MKSILSILLLILGMVMAAALRAAQPAAPQGGSASGLELSLEALPEANTFFLRALNRGPANALLVRPRSGMVDRFEGWGGWSLEVRGPGGPFLPMTLPGGVPPHTSLDLIELRPGESVGVVFNLDRHVNRQRAALAGTPGTFTLVARYQLAQDKVYRASAEPGGSFVDVPPLPPAQSRALAWVVPKGPERNGQK